jgi:adenylate kinase family enzyme
VRPGRLGRPPRTSARRGPASRERSTARHAPTITTGSRSASTARRARLAPGPRARSDPRAFANACLGYRLDVDHSDGPPRRIAVIGRAGSGKTTVALWLGQAFALPIIHLDQLYWTSDWKPRPDALFESEHVDVIGRERWVIDGSYLGSPALAERLQRADLVVITSAPILTCLARVIRRSVRDRGRDRPDRPIGADEALSLTFLVWVVRWSWRHRDLEDEVRRLAPHVHVAVIRGQADLRALGVDPPPRS